MFFESSCSNVLRTTVFDVCPSMMGRLAMVAARQISRPRLWNVHARIVLPVLAMMRCDMSPADALVNDNTRISSGVARFVASSHAIYPTMVVVLPVPAPASTRVL